MWSVPWCLPPTRFCPKLRVEVVTPDIMESLLPDGCANPSQFLELRSPIANAELALRGPRLTTLNPQ